MTTITLMRIVKNDVKLVFRDRFMLMMVILPVIMIIGFRFLFDSLATSLQITTLMPVLSSFVLLLGPMMMGFIIGFIYLDEKDDDILQAVRVLPVSITRIFASRFLWGYGLAFIITLISPYILNLSFFTFWENLGLAGMLALECPILALAVCSFAKNKVEGMAAFKFLGILFEAPIAIIFIKIVGWHYAFAPIFSFWPIKIIFTILQDGPNLIWLFLGGYCIHFITLLITGYLFRRNMLNFSQK